jgi:chitin disaccharide deacetylase
MAALPERRIAVCIDDFGLHQGVNDAAMALASLERITAISCMVGAPAWRSGAPSLARLDPKCIDIGLHLDLTEHPLDPASHRPLPLLAALSETRLIERGRLRAEINAQLDAFEEQVARPPAHIDGHQHVHQFPVVRELLIEALLERYPHRRPWLRRTKPPSTLPSAGFKPWLIGRLGCDQLTRLAHAQGFGQNEHLLGVYDFQGSAERYAMLLGQWMGAAAHGDLLMCHASFNSLLPDPMRKARGNEYMMLSSGTFADLLEREGVALGVLSTMQPVA